MPHQWQRTKEHNEREGEKAATKDEPLHSDRALTTKVIPRFTYVKSARTDTSIEHGTLPSNVVVGDVISYNITWV